MFIISYFLIETSIASRDSLELTLELSLELSVSVNVIGSDCSELFSKSELCTKSLT